ncbi:MAG: Fe-S cluster assembly protein SufD [Flavobacteriaceae bacterium]|nr:Fe-S cluster assembly protein SufD [Flavobacteriaceae bacterium]
MRSLEEKLISEHILFDQWSKRPTLMEKLREDAINEFEKTGFPTTKLEDWKYTSLKPFLNKDYVLFSDNHDVPINYSDVKTYFIHDIDSYNLVFINGKYSSYLSTTTHDEADVCVLSSAMRQGKYQTVIESFYNKIARAEQMVSLNTAYTHDGAYIHVPDKVILSKPIQIMNFYIGEKPLISHPRNLIILGNNAQARIIERHQTINSQENFTNSVTEIHVGKNAHLDYYKIQNDDNAASLVDSTYIDQERDSVASVHTFSFGGKLIRNGLNFNQKGENCNSILKGVTIGEDEQLIDHHTFVEHMSPNCESHELYRTILGGSSKGVFNGKILVDADAQKIDAFQQNNNILLTPGASIDTKPQLEIFADDVKCSHGCTVGQLDESAMFYLRQRGVPKKEARALLLFAFSADVLESIQIPELKQRITRIIAKKLEVNLSF